MSMSSALAEPEIAQAAAADVAVAKAVPEAPVDLPTAVAAFNDARAETKDEVIESEDFVDALYLGIASTTHVYVCGSGGVGKTFGAEITAQHFGVESFYAQFRNDTKREEIFGPLSMTALQRDEYRHNTQGYLPEAWIAVLDEFGDAGRFTRQLLNALNERWFVNGGVRGLIPLKTAIGTTNVWLDDTALEALMDRFAQRLEQKGVQTSTGFKKILKGQIERDANAALGIVKESSYTVIDPDQLHAIIRAGRLVRVDKHIVDLIDGLRKAAQQAGIEMSPRRWYEGLRLAKANAVLNGRDHVTEDDLRVYSRVLANHLDDFTTAKDLTKGFRDKLTQAAEDAEGALLAINELLDPIKAIIANGERPSDLAPVSEANTLAIKLVEQVQAAQKSNGGRTNEQLDRVLTSVQDAQDLMSRIILGRPL